MSKEDKMFASISQNNCINIFDGGEIEKGLPIVMTGVKGFQAETWVNGQYIMAHSQNKPQYRRTGNDFYIDRAKIGYVGKDSIPVLERPRNDEDLDYAIVQIDCGFSKEVTLKYSTGFTFDAGTPELLCLNTQYITSTQGKRRQGTCAILKMKNGDEVSTVHWTNKAYKIKVLGNSISFEEIEPEEMFATIHLGIALNLAETREVKKITAALHMVKEVIDFRHHDEDYALLVKIFGLSESGFTVSQEILNCLRAAYEHVDGDGKQILIDRRVVSSNLVILADERVDRAFKPSTNLALAKAKRKDRSDRDREERLASKGGGSGDKKKKHSKG